MLQKEGCRMSLKILSPLADEYGGEQGLRPISPRLDTLKGKRIGLLWNGKPNGDVALQAVADVLQKKNPEAEFVFYSGAKPFAADMLAQALAECDGFIAAAADCGSCTSWLAHDCVQAERDGKPAVIIAADGFGEDVKSTAQAFGLTHVEYATVARPFSNLTEEQARQQTEVVADDVARLLTVGKSRASDAADPSAGEEDVPDVLEFHDSSEGTAFEEFNRMFLDRDWGDGFPLWPPTPERVGPLIEATGRPASDVVCYLPPGNGTATIEKVAVNAAMAGCTGPEMPVLLAALRAISNYYPMSTRTALMSTSAHAPMVLVNGPIARELGINGGRGCIGPGRNNKVNLRIGRALALCLRTVARWRPGVMDLDSQGTTRKNIVVVAENEDESPWEAYHVNVGFRPDDNVVTVFFTGGEWDVCIQGHVDADQLARSIAIHCAGVFGIGYLTSGVSSERLEGVPHGRLLLMSPEHAIPLSEGGYTKRSFERYLFHNVVESAWRLMEPARKMYMDGHVNPEYRWLFDLPYEEAQRRMLPVVEESDRWTVVVAGSSRGKDMLMPTRVRQRSERII
jgi:hypothetical protein